MRWRVTRTPQYFWWWWWWTGDAPAGQRADGRDRHLAARSRRDLRGHVHAGGRRAAGQGVEGPDLPLLASTADVIGRGRRDALGRRAPSAWASSRSRRGGCAARASCASRSPAASRSCGRTSTACRGPGKGSWRLCGSSSRRRRCSRPTSLPNPSSEPRRPDGRSEHAGRRAAAALGHRVLAGADDARAGRTARRSRAASSTHDAKGEASARARRRCRPAPTGSATDRRRVRRRLRDAAGASSSRGGKTPLALPARPLAESALGDGRRHGAASSWRRACRDQTLFFDIYRAGRRVERRDPAGGSRGRDRDSRRRRRTAAASASSSRLVRDHQFMTLTQSVFVPWDDKELKVCFATFRDS